VRLIWAGDFDFIRLGVLFINDFILNYLKLLGLRSSGSGQKSSTNRLLLPQAISGTFSPPAYVPTEHIHAETRPSDCTFRKIFARKPVVYAWLLSINFLTMPSIHFATAIRWLIGQ
jgi:hypothetical protein